MKKIYKTIILGSGVGGLSAGKLIKDSIILEKQETIPKNLQNGVHYLHSIPKIKTNIKYKQIRLDECVFNSNDCITQKPNLYDAMLYSYKAIGIIQPTSIFQLGKRNHCFVPQSNDMNDLIDDLAKNCNIEFGEEFKKIDLKEKIINDKYKYNYLLSTISLKTLLQLIGIPFKIEFNSNKIYTYNYKIYTYNYCIKNIKSDWLISIYIARDDFYSYRMSILNNQISVESNKSMEPVMVYKEIKKIFPFLELNEESFKEGKWDTGKVISISVKNRKNILEQLLKHNIIPFGRYGQWDRRLLIDSTIEQANIIANFIKKKISKKELIEKLLNVAK
mgnify:CR=1 FL=1